MAPSPLFVPHQKSTSRVPPQLGSRLTHEDLEDSESNGSPGLKLFCQGLNIFYGGTQVVFEVDLGLRPNEVLALIGPSGSGKTSILRCLNRMSDHNPSCRVSGSVWFDGKDIYSENADAVSTRMAIGMVFQRPNPYPRSIYENIAYGLRIHGKVSCVSEESALVEKCLRQAGLWEELGQRLGQSAMELSLGQQQRLCIARALAINPEVILMDEPCSSLDPVSTAIVEALIEELGRRTSILIVTQSLQQAARVSKRTAFLHRGRMVEIGPTARFFTSPRHALTVRYLSGWAGRFSEDFNHE